jgi:ADP-ribose pyrophosphatase YjhB (NUDIX family)
MKCNAVKCFVRNKTENGVASEKIPTINKRDDYISFYIVEHFKEGQRPPSTEIAEVAWFSLKELPEDISPSTHRRIEEYLGKRPVSDR